MIPIRLELQNFLCYRTPPPVDLDGILIGCVCGENGAGKSSLLDAITWALWGRARTSSPDDLITQGQSEMRVGLTFDLGDQRYQVIRQRKAGRTGQSLLELQVRNGTAWNSLSEHSLRATQEKIITLLRLDYETFVNSAFLVQGRADEFTTKPPGARKQVLANILGLSAWEAYEDKAKDVLRQLHDQTQRVQGQLLEIDRELGRRAEYEAELAAAQVEAERIAERVRVAEGEWAVVEGTSVELAAVQRQIEGLDVRVRQTEHDLQELEVELAATRIRADGSAIAAEIERTQAAQAELEAVEVEHGEGILEQRVLGEEGARLRGENEALVPQTEPLKRRVETLGTASEPVCPTCGQALTDDHRHRLLAELNAEVDVRRERYRQNQRRVKEIDERVTALTSRLEGLAVRLRARAPLQQRLSAWQAARDGAEAAQAQVAVLAERRGRWQATLQADQSARAALDEQAQRLHGRLRGAAATREALDRLRYEKRLADERVGGARQTLAALASYEKQRQVRQAERERLAQDQSLVEELREAFGKRGVPAMIIEAAVPEIEAAANELLGRMTSGRMHVRIETQREIRTGDLRESLDITIADELGSRSYEMYSGGEAFRVNFAIRIALSKLLARRAGAQLRTLFIDEGFGTQDSVGRERLVAAIHAIQNDFDRILVITHLDELKDLFPVRLDVMRTPEGSVVQVS